MLLRRALVRARTTCFVAAMVLSAVAFGSATTRASADPPTVFDATFPDEMPASARAGARDALARWAEHVHSPVPITIDFAWSELPRNVVGATDVLSFARTAPDGAFDPAALANFRRGADLEPAHADMRITLNAREAWHFGLAAAPSGRTDLVSFVLHEVGHGLGLLTSAPSTPHPLAMDRFLSDTAARPMVWTGSARDSHLRAIAVYSPTPFEPHCSHMHLDEATYPAGDPDALMTPKIKRGESIRSIGPAALGMLADLGWSVTYAEPPRHVSLQTAKPATVVTASTVAPSSSPTTDTPVVISEVAAATPVEPRPLQAVPVSWMPIVVTVAVGCLVRAHEFIRRKRRTRMPG